MLDSQYRRPLPEGLVAFASDAGRTLFREALADGHLEGFFALAEQFHTQAEPAFCGLASLVVVLNALGVDPGRLWKGPWRWYSEELLDCCAPLDRVRQHGVSLDQLACLARCNGAQIELGRANEGGPEPLREAIREACRQPRGPMVVVGYARADLGQTGDGHFSPVGGYHSARDLVLILDVARFKYPPHWVPLEGLHAAMSRADPATGHSRGWLVLRRSALPRSLLLSVSARASATNLVSAFHVQIPTRMREANDAEGALRAFALAAGELCLLVDEREALAPEHQSAVEAVRCTLGATEVYAIVAPLLPRARDAAIVAALVLAAPEATWAGLTAKDRAALAEMLDRGRCLPGLAPEITQLREQIDAIIAS